MTGETAILIKNVAIDIAIGIFTFVSFKIDTFVKHFLPSESIDYPVLVENIIQTGLAILIIIRILKAINPNIFKKKKDED